MIITIDCSLDEAAVEAKVKKYLNSPQGKKKLQDKVNQYIDNDTRQSQGGSKIVTLAWANELARELCDLINSHAAGAGLAESVQAHVQSLTPLWAERGHLGSVKAGLSFRDANMARPSVIPQIYGGVDNIVAMFEFGWNAKAPLFGWWHIVHDYVQTRQFQPPLHFIGSAVEEFNSKYASLDVHVEVMWPYG